MDYERIEQEESPQALRLARWIKREINPKNIVDIGCATGFYLYPFEKHKYLGIDYNKNDKYTLFTRHKKYPKIELLNFDLSKPLKDELTLDRYDLGICLEVAEHIDEKFENIFIDNVVSLCRTLIFSAAPPGQSGDGHINLKAKAYWLKHFEHRGMFYDAFESQSLLGYMLQGAHMGWFTNNAFIVTGRY
jgi:2-polyprenyl-3-methyl-5-hydroxy-6-metoxy-1,4-benzoquinol methylase